MLDTKVSKKKGKKVKKENLYNADKLSYPENSKEIKKIVKEGINNFMRKKRYQAKIKTPHGSHVLIIDAQVRNKLTFQEVLDCLKENYPDCEILEIYLK